MASPTLFTSLRWRRFAAGVVVAGPLLSPLAVFVGLAASGEGRSMRGMGPLLLVFLWGSLAAFATFLWFVVDLVRLARKKPSLAFGYTRLAVVGARPLRQLLAAVAVMFLPVLGGWGASAACSAARCSYELENYLIWCTPMALWCFNFLFLLGPSARTLGDRLGGGRIEQQAPQLRRAWWPDVWLLVPPVLGLPASAGWGGCAGLLVAFAILCVPLWLARRSDANANRSSTVSSARA